MNTRVFMQPILMKFNIYLNIFGHVILEISIWNKRKWCTRFLLLKTNLKCYTILKIQWLVFYFITSQMTEKKRWNENFNYKISQSKRINFTCHLKLIKLFSYFWEIRISFITFRGTDFLTSEIIKNFM